MHCPACQAENPDAAKFCSECGGRLAVVCSACGTPASGGKFCAECGGALRHDVTSTAGAVDLPSQRAAEAPVSERRMTSLLFADLVGFTTLSETRDHEEVRELLSRYFTVARTVVGRYGGTVEKFIGDAVMAVWGVPAAHEDDAERAVRAGLDLVEALSAMGESVGAPELTMRVGVVTGEVAVTLGATGEGMVAGDPVNTAARIQSVANPGEVWVDDATRSLTMAAVMFEDAGEHALKGKAEPVQLFVARQIVAAVGGAQRVDGLEAPFTGHERELRLIKEMFHATQEERRARLVSVLGAAGVGKSRIGWEFEKYIDGMTRTTWWHRGRCLAYGEGVAFWAFAEMMRGRFGVVDGDPPAVVVAKLDEGLGKWLVSAEERAWLRPRIGTLLDLGDLVAHGESFPRADLFAAWRLLLERMSEKDDGVVALVFEDLQWADDGLLDFIDYLLESARFSLFILTLARAELAETHPHWGSSRRATQVYLDPLVDEQMSRLIDGLVGGLPDEVRKALVERAEGIPLYAVETVRSMVDRDAVVPRDGRYVLADRELDVASLGAPASLHALIASRLDALPPAERRAVQDASVLGMSFTADGLRAINDDGGDLAAVLAALVRKEFLHVDADPFSPERGQYRFVQGLVRTVAYETLARRDRKARHLAAAAFYSEQAEGDELAGVVASHYLDAIENAPADDDTPDLRRKARGLLEQAARRASALGASVEALRYHESALQLAEDDAEIARLSLAAAEAALVIARHNQAVQHALVARDAYLRLGDEIAAAAALALAGEAWVNLGEGPRALSELQPVYEAMDGRPGAERAMSAIAMQLASAVRSLARPTESVRFYERAIELSEATADWARLARALNSYGGSIASTGRPVMGLALMKGSLELARREQVPGVVMSLNNLVAMQIYRDLPAALAAGAEGLEMSRRLGETAMEIWVGMNYMFALWLAGRWDDLLAVYAELPHEYFPATQLRPLRLCVASVLAARGGLAELDLTDLAPVTDDVNEQAFDQILAATVAMGNGRTAEWAEAGIRGTDLMHGMAGIDDDYSMFWPLGVEGALAAGRVDDAIRLIGQVASSPRGLVPPYLVAQLKRFEALLAIQQGRNEGVDEALAEASEDLRRFGAPYWCARTLLDRGLWLRENGRGVEASTVLADARRMFTDLGATPWVERVPQTVADARLQGVVD